MPPFSLRSSAALQGRIDGMFDGVSNLQRLREVASPAERAAHRHGHPLDLYIYGLYSYGLYSYGPSNRPSARPIIMACTAMVYIGMVYLIMAHRRGHPLDLYRYCLYNYGPSTRPSARTYSYGLYPI